MWKLKVSEGESHDPLVPSFNNHTGRQFWQFHPTLGTPDDRASVERFRNNYAKNRRNLRQNSDMLMRHQLSKTKLCSEDIIEQVKIEIEDDITEEEVVTTLRRALKFYSSIQCDDGHWAGDYGGPLFLLPGMVITLFVMDAWNVAVSAEHQKEMRRYIYNLQNEDGGWGLHIHGHSTMFGTALNYVSLRLLGEGVHDGDGAMEKARTWIQEHGGATYIPSWGKCWLSILGVYEWGGNNPLSPELWLLPYSVPMHPGRMWCHCRMVYLPMSYLYGKRFVAPVNSTTLSLRKELYLKAYDKIDWNSARNQCCKEDLFYPHPFLQDVMWKCLHEFAEPLLMHWPLNKLRSKALATVMKHIQYEDENTNYVCIGPVSKVLNMLCRWVDDPNSRAVELHLARVKDYLWLAEDGMKMQAYNGSQSWDTALAIHAILATNLVDECGVMLKKAHEFIIASQIRKDSSGHLCSWYRHSSKGGWTFSTADQGWPVSDCTAECLKAGLLLSQLPKEIAGEAMKQDMTHDAVDLLLSLQNSNGGFASYELTRSYAWLEMLNPSENLADIMIDYQYVECTSSVIQALELFTNLHRGYRRKDIKACIEKAVQFIESRQLPDGSWYGSWGICYIYGTWFALTGLLACGGTYENSLCIRKACDFLLSKEIPSGGWGESYLSSQNKVYTTINEDKPHIVSTGWAMLALMEAGQVNRDSKPLHRAAKILINAQMQNGDFPQQEIIGVTNTNLMMTYSAYRNIFSIWAIGMYLNKVLEQ